MFGHLERNDEYVNQRKKQFKVEGLYLILLLLLLNAGRGIIVGDFSSHVLLSIGILFVFVWFYMFRSIFTGIEYPNITGQKGYKRKRKEILIYSSVSFVIFLLLNIGNKLIFKPHLNWIDIIGVSVVFLILWTTINYVSLKRSYKKNCELDTEE